MVGWRSIHRNVLRKVSSLQVYSLDSDRPISIWFRSVLLIRTARIVCGAGLVKLSSVIIVIIITIDIFKVA